MSESGLRLCFVLSAPSGAGKTTLAEELIARVAGLTRTVSWTTREPRQEEVDGRDYRFVGSEEFEAHREAGGFLESAIVHGNLYGTPVSEVERINENGDDTIMVIDVQGAAQIREKLDDAVTIIVLPSSRGVLESRLGGREGADAANDETIDRRLGVAAEEIAQFVRYDYVVINDEFEQAVRELASIVVAERCRRRLRAPAAEEILRSFRQRTSG